MTPRAKLLRVRKRFNLTQSQLAQLLGVNSVTVSKTESKNEPFPCRAGSFAGKLLDAPKPQGSSVVEMMESQGAVNTLIKLCSYSCCFAFALSALPCSLIY